MLKKQCPFVRFTGFQWDINVCFLRAAHTVTEEWSVLPAVWKDLQTQSIALVQNALKSDDQEHWFTGSSLFDQNSNESTWTSNRDSRFVKQSPFCNFKNILHIMHNTSLSQKALYFGICFSCANFASWKEAICRPLNQLTELSINLQLSARCIVPTLGKLNNRAYSNWTIKNDK